MASSIPFDPDDLENNPFATAVDQPKDRLGNVGSENNDHTNEEAQEFQGENEEQFQNHLEGYNSQREGEGQMMYDQISEEEMRRLLPERFTKKYSMNIKLQGIEKYKPNNPILRFDATVNGLPKFRQSNYSDIRRTYNETQKFRKYLAISNLEVLVPVLPLVATSFPAGMDEEKKILMYEWQVWFDRITRNPILIRDEEFVYFLESDFGYSVINSAKKAPIASGIMRKTLKQLALPYDPYKELSEFRPLIKTAYLECQKLNKLLTSYSRSEKHLATEINDMSGKLNELHLVEANHPGMRNMWEKVSKVMSIQADLSLVQLTNDMGTLGDTVKNLESEFYEIKEALTNRHLIMRDLLNAQSDTNRKHNFASKVKNKAAFDPIRADEAIQALELASKVEESLRLQVIRISGEMLYGRKEILEFVEKKFREVLRDFTLNKVEHHRKILKHYEHIRLDIRKIDEKGGLSRLNRGNLASLQHKMVDSQAKEGDSWSSRTFRSLNKNASDKERRQPRETNIDNVADAKNVASLLGVATF